MKPRRYVFLIGEMRSSNLAACHACMQYEELVHEPCPTGDPKAVLLVCAKCGEKTRYGFERLWCGVCGGYVEQFKINILDHPETYWDATGLQKARNVRILSGACLQCEGKQVIRGAVDDEGNAIAVGIVDANGNPVKQPGGGGHFSFGKEYPI